MIIRKIILAMCVLMKLDGWNGCTQMDGWMNKYWDTHACIHVCMYVCMDG
jgi:hypothetical protein